jgi:uncharacterized protein YchJ
MTARDQKKIFIDVTTTGQMEQMCLCADGKYFEGD